jgi:hypothetical protein
MHYGRMRKAESVVLIKFGGETDSVVLDFKVGKLHKLIMMAESI